MLQVDIILHLEMRWEMSESGIQRNPAKIPSSWKSVRLLEEFMIWPGQMIQRGLLQLEMVAKRTETPSSQTAEHQLEKSRVIQRQSQLLTLSRLVPIVL